MLSSQAGGVLVIEDDPDDGPGIEEDKLNIIFQRFKQVGQDIRASTKGFGLGLNISKEIVAMNFGEMEVQSALGQGSTFSFTVPTADPVRLIDR